MPGRLTIGSKNQKIGDHYLRIGPIGGFVGWTATTFRHQTGSLFFPGGFVALGSPPQGAGTYILILFNADLVDVTDGTHALEHSEVTTAGGGWPDHDTQFHKITVGSGEQLTRFDYTVQSDNIHAGFDGHWQLYGIGYTDSPPLINLRFIEVEPTHQRLHAQSEDGHWTPVLPSGTYEVDVNFNISVP